MALRGHLEDVVSLNQSLIASRVNHEFATVFNFRGVVQTVGRRGPKHVVFDYAAQVINIRVVVKLRLDVGRDAPLQRLVIEFFETLPKSFCSVNRRTVYLPTPLSQWEAYGRREPTRG